MKNKKLLKMLPGVLAAAACCVFCLTAGIPVFPDGETVSNESQAETAASGAGAGDAFSPAQKAELEELIRAELRIYLTSGTVLQSAGSDPAEVGSALEEASERNKALEAEGKININTADEEELMQLRGIGEARAREVIRYRTEHGPFASIEDIMNVSGIKEAAFAQIKDSIFV